MHIFAMTQDTQQGVWGEGVSHSRRALHDSQLDPLGAEIDTQHILRFAEHRGATPPDE